jgi:polyhydroxyalkanoate synthase
MQKALPAPGNLDLGAYQVKDPVELGQNILRAMEMGAKVWAEMAEKQGGVAAMGKPPSASSGSLEMPEPSKAFATLWQSWMSDPSRLSEAQGTLVAGYLQVWQNTLQKIAGVESHPVAEPEVGDNRFRDPEWNSNAYFDFWKQSYLLTVRWAEQLLDDTSGLDERSRHQAEFALKQVAAAFAPTNFPATNPEVIRETVASNAANVVAGMKQLLEDVRRSDDQLKISQTDTSAFEVGRNIAITPGKVVFQNDLLQLIQYTPTTEKVRAVPFLIVPPWINKFYILDLSPQKSFIKYMVDQGFSVFVVSWVNPDERLKHKSFEDYMKEGILAAADAVKRETGEKKCNVLGYCVGGTLLYATLAYLAARREDVFQSATFLTAQADFTKAGDLKLFIDDEQLKSLEARMDKTGYLEGSAMAGVFNMLRPKDLIWPYIINNYMLGRKPFPFDLLYWNQDSTRMPAANHNFYLREFYLENRMAKGDLVLSGEKLDLEKIKLPVYHLAAKEDHIAPVRSVYAGALMLGGPVEFVMSGSGHIAGVVNPPDPKKIKYQYWTNSDRVDNLDEWMEGAKETPGSWWPHFSAWLAKQSKGMIEARKPGRKLGTIEDAPGSYVKAKGK